MTRLVNGLPDRTGKKAGEFIVVQEPSPEGNRCLKTDVAIAKSKNWNTLKYNTDIHKTVPYEGEEPIPYAVTLTKEGEVAVLAQNKVKDRIIRNDKQECMFRCLC